MPLSDAAFRRGLASCLFGILAMLFAASLSLTGLAVGYPYAAGFGFVGLLIAIAGFVTGIVGVLRIERSARDPGV